MFQLVSLALIGATYAQCPMPTYLGTIQHEYAAFLDVLPNDQNGNDLFITSFMGAPFSKGKVSRIPDIASYLESESDLASVKAKIVDPHVKWPNGAKRIPEHVEIPFTRSNYRVLSCGGFLVPTHGDGQCTVYDIDGKRIRSHVLATAGEGSFFHQGTWYDVNGDGLDDLVVAKATKPRFGDITGSLFWYENPGAQAYRGQPWTEHLLLDGPDVHFELVDLDHDGIDEIVATQFFSQRLTVSWLKEGSAFDGGPEAWEQRAVVKDCGHLFNMAWIDLDLDGKKEIVMTNHENDALFSGVYAVQVPKHFRTAKWKTHLLQNDFETLNEGPGQASPGGIVHVDLDDEEYPVFAISGDGNQKAYIMCKSEDGGKWSWEREEFLDTGNTVGAIAVSDVTGDGRPELFVPSFEQGEIHVYSYDLAFRK